MTAPLDYRVMLAKYIDYAREFIGTDAIVDGVDCGGYDPATGGTVFTAEEWAELRRMVRAHWERHRAAGSRPWLVP